MSESSRSSIPNRNRAQARQSPIHRSEAPAATRQMGSNVLVPEGLASPVSNLNQQTAAFGSAIQQIALLQSLLSGGTGQSQITDSRASVPQLTNEAKSGNPSETDLARAQTGNTDNSPAEEPAQLSQSEPPPGVVMVPCRARGMPQDHNSKVSTTDSTISNSLTFTAS